MSELRKLWKKAAQIITASDINTCYYAPQARKNRIPAYFEQLEPRQLLSATHQPDTENPPNDQNPPVVADNEAGPGDALANLDELLRQATNLYGPDLSGLPGSVGLVIPSFEGFLDSSSYDFFSGGQDILDNTLAGDMFGPHDKVWFSSSPDLVLAGTFTAADGYGSMLIMASGQVDLQGVNFTGFDSIVIRASSVIFGGGETIIQGGQLIISALDCVKFQSTVDIKNDGGLGVYAADSITVADGAQIKGSGDVYLSSMTISMVRAAIDISGDFTAEAAAKAYVPPFLGALPLTIAQGEARIELKDTVITAKSVTITATAVSETAGYLLSKAELTDEDLAGYLANPAPHPDTLDTLKEFYAGPAPDASMLVTHGYAKAEVFISGGFITASAGDVKINAASVVTSTQGENDSFAFVLAINEAFAIVTVTENTTISAGHDVSITAKSENTATQVAVAGAAQGPKAPKAAFAVAIGRTEALVLLEAQSVVTADHDILVASDTMESFNLSASAEAAGSLAIVTALASTTVTDSTLKADGGLTVRSFTRADVRSVNVSESHSVSLFSAGIKNSVFTTQNIAQASAKTQVTDSDLTAVGKLTVAADNQAVAQAALENREFDISLPVNAKATIESGELTAQNNLTASAETQVTRSTLKAGGDLTVAAKNEATAQAGLGSGTFSGEQGLGLGAFSAKASLESGEFRAQNIVTASAKTQVTDSTLKAGGDLTVDAGNLADAQADIGKNIGNWWEYISSGKLGLGDFGVSGANIGGEFALFTAQNNVDASSAEILIKNSDLTAGGDLAVAANNKTVAVAAVVDGDISWELNFGRLGPVTAESMFAISVVLAMNEAASEADVLIDGSVLTADADLTIDAVNDARFEAAAVQFSASIAIAGSRDKGAAVSLGGEVWGVAAANTISSIANTLVSNSTLKAGLSINPTLGAGRGLLAVRATNETAVKAAAVSMGLSVNIKNEKIGFKDDRFSVDLGGVPAVNTVTGGAYAEVAGGDLSSKKGDLEVTALNKADILAVAVNAAMAITKPGTEFFGLGLYTGVNVISLDSAAEITGDGQNTVSADGNLSVTAHDESKIWTLAVAASVNGSVGLANTTSVVKDSTVRAGLTGVKTVTAGGDLTVEAKSTAQIVSIAIGMAVAVPSGAVVQVNASENIVARDVIAELARINEITVGGDLVVRAHEAQPVAIGDWRNKSWLELAGVRDVEAGALSALNTAVNTAVAEAGVSGRDPNPNEALFKPQSGIFSLAVSMAASVKGATVAGAVTFNWLERSTTAVVDDVSGIKFTSAAKGEGQTGSLLVEAVSSAAAFGGVLSLGVSGGGDLGTAAAVNVLDNNTQALIKNCQGCVIGGWDYKNLKWDSSKFGGVTVKAENTSGATALAVGVDAGTKGIGPSISLNLGLSKGKELGDSKDVTRDTARALSQEYAENMAEKGASPYTTGSADYDGKAEGLGGESAEAGLVNFDAVIHSSGKLLVEAVQNSVFISDNLSLGAGAAGVSGAVAMNLLKANSSAYVEGGALTTTAAVAVRAETKGAARAYLVAVSGAGTGFSGLISLSRVAGNAQAYLEGGQITAGSLLVEAYADTDILTLGVAGAAGGGAGAGAAALALAGNTVSADVTGTTLKLTGDLKVQATNKTKVITKALSMVGGGSAGTVAAAVNLSEWADAAAFDPSSSKYAGNKSTTDAMLDYLGGKTFSTGFTTRASVDSDSISITAGGLAVVADNQSAYTAALLLGAFAGGGGGSGGFAFNLMDSLSVACLNIAGSLAVDRLVKVEARNTTRMWATILALAGTGGGAGAGTLALNVAKVSAQAEIRGGERADFKKAGSVEVHSDAEAGLEALSLAGAGTGSVAVGGSFAVNAVEDVATAAIYSAADKLMKMNVTSGLVDVHTENKSTITAATVGAAGAGVGAGGLAVAVNVSSKSGDKLKGIAKTGTEAGKGTNLVADADYDKIDGDGIFINDAPYGAPAFVSGQFKEIASSTALLENVELTAGSLKVNAESSRENVTAAAGGAGAGTGTAGLAVAVSVGDNLTQALVQKSTLTITGDVDVLAVNESHSYTIAVALAGAGGGVGGAGVGVSVDTGDTNATLSGVNIINAGNVTVKAATHLNAFTLTFAGAGATGAGVASVAVTEIRGATQAQILNSAINARGTVSALAELKPADGPVHLRSLDLGAVRSGLTDVLDRVQKELDKVFLDANSIKAEETRFEEDDKSRSVPNAFANSLTASGILSIASSLAGGVGAVCGGVSVNKLTGDVRVKVEGSEITAENVMFNALMRTAVQSYVPAAVVAGVGLAASISVNTISGETTADLNSVKLTLGGRGEVSAIRDLSITGMTGAVGIGGGAVGFGLVLNTLSGAVAARVNGGVISVGGKKGLREEEFLVKAERCSSIRSYSFGASGGLGAFSGGVAVNTLKGDTVASISGGAVSSIDNTGRLNVQALENTTAVTLGVQAAFGGFALPAGVAVIRAAGTVSAGINNAALSNLSSVSVDATSKANLIAKGIGAALGAVGVGAVVSGITLGDANGGAGTVTAGIAGSTLTNINSVKVTGRGEWNLYAYSLAGVGSGIFGVGATSSKARLYSTVDAHMSGVIMNDVGEVVITATGAPKVLAVAVTPSVSLAGAVGVALAEADIAPIINAYAANLSAERSSGRTPGLTVEALLEAPSSSGVYSAEARGYAFAGSLLASGGGAVSKITDNSRVKAYVGAITKDSVFSSLTVRANNSASLNAYATCFGGALGAGVGVAKGVINSVTNTEAYIIASQAVTTIHGKLTVQAESSLFTDQRSRAGAGAVGLAAAAAVAEQNLSATTTSRIGQAVFNAGDIELSAKSKFETNQSLKADEISLLGGAGGDGFIGITADTKAEVGAGAKLTAQNINILSQNILTRGIAGHLNGTDSTAYGAITVQAGGTVTQILANSEVIIGAGAELLGTGYAGKRLTLQAFNFMDIEDSLAFASGSLLEVAVVSGAMNATLNAGVTIGENAKVKTDSALGSDIIIHAGSYERASLEVGASIWGLASTGTLKAGIGVNTANKISVKKDAKIYSTRDLVIAAGAIGYEYVTKENGGIGQTDFHLSGEIFDSSLIPAAGVKNIGLTLNRDNLITVETGADLKSRGDAELYALQKAIDISDLNATSHNWLSGLLGNAKHSADPVLNINNLVTMDGTLTAGVDNTIEAEIYEFNETNWEKYKDKLEPAERERIETLMSRFESIFGVKYFDYLKEAVKPTATANFYNANLDKANGLTSLEWKEFIAGQDESDIDSIVRKFMREVFVNLGQSDMDTLKNLNVAAYQEQIADLLKLLDLKAAEAVYQGFWQSFIDRDNALALQQEYFTALKHVNYNLQALQASHPAAAQYIWTMTYNLGYTAEAMNGAEWRELEKALDVNSHRLTSAQKEAITLIIDYCNGRYADAEKMLAAYGYFMAPENTALRNAAFVSAGGWKAFTEAFLEKLPSAPAEAWAALFPASACPSIQDASFVKPADWQACYDEFRQIIRDDYYVEPVFGPNWNAELEAAYNKLADNRYDFSKLGPADPARNTLLNLANKYLETAYTKLGDVEYDSGKLTPAYRNILLASVTERVGSAHAALARANYNFNALSSPAHQNILQMTVNAFVAANFNALDNAARQDYWLNNYTCDAIRHGNEMTLAAAIRAIRGGLDENVLTTLDSVKEGHAAIFHDNFWKTLQSNSQKLIRTSLTTAQETLLTLIGLKYCDGRPETMALFGKNAFKAYTHAYAQLCKSVADASDIIDQLKQSFFTSGTNSHLLTYSMGKGAIESNLVDEYKAMEHLALTYGPQDPAAQLVQDQLQGIRKKLIAYGYAYNEGGVFMLKDLSSVNVLSVTDTLISKGSVRIYAGSDLYKGKLTGNGFIEAKGDAIFKLTNKIAGTVLSVGNITISAKESGKVYIFGGASSLDKNHIKEANAEGSTVLMKISQEQPAMLLVKDLYNISGVTNLYSVGDLSIIGAVFARQLDVLALGTITISLAKNGDNADFYSAGGNPVNIDGPYDDDINNFQITGTQGGSLIALGNININADKLNVNGLIQSGVASYNISIGKDQKAGGTLYIHGDGTVTSQWKDQTSRALQTYGYENNTYTVDFFYAGGGDVYITGTVLNTNEGRGNIAVYTNPAITIVNESSADLVVKDLNTGKNAPGGIYLWNTDKDGWDNLLDNGATTYKPTTDLQYSYQSGSEYGKTKIWTITTEDLWGFVHNVYPDFKSIPTTSEKVSEGFEPLDPTAGFFASGSLIDTKLDQLNTMDGITILERGDNIRDLAGYNANVSGKYVIYEIVTESSGQIPYGEPDYRWNLRYLFNFTKYTIQKYIEISTIKRVIWLIVDANQLINLNGGQGLKTGQGTGNITITSAGSVILDGGLTANGSIEIKSEKGVIDAGESWIKSATGEVTITTNNGSIGTADNRLKIVAPKADRTLTMTAKGATRQSGAIYAQVNGGNVEVKATADQLIDLSVSHVLTGSLSAPKLVLAAGGGLGAAKNDRLTLGNHKNATAGVIVTAEITSGQGNMFLAGTTDMRLVRLVAPGAVDIDTDFSIYDANDQDAIDQRDLDRLESMWKRLGILASDNEAEYAQQVQDKVDLLCVQLNAAYHGYHDSNNAVNEAGSGYERQLKAFDPSLLENPYDKDLKITAKSLSDEQRDALEELAKSSLFTREILTSKMSEALLNGTTSTLFTETANIAAGYINLKAHAIGDASGRRFIINDYNKKLDEHNEKYAGYVFTSDDIFFLGLLELIKADPSIGEYGLDPDPAADTMTIQLWKYEVKDYDKKMKGEPEYEFTELDKFFIWTSEASERKEYNPLTDTLTVKLSDDLNVQLTGNLTDGSGRLDLTATAHAFIGTGVVSQSVVGNQDLAVGTATVTNGELRIKADGSLFTTAGGSLNAGSKIGGAYLVVEASNGDLGQADNYLNIGSHSLLRLRAYGKMYVHGDGDLNIDAIGKEAGPEAYIESDKNIIITNDMVIVPENTWLTAGADVRLKGRTSVETRKDSAITAQNFMVETPKASLDGKVVAAGDIGVTNSREIKILGNADMYAGGDVLLTAEKRLETRGNSNVTAGHKAVLKGESISLGGNVTAGADARLTAETSLETGATSTVTAGHEAILKGRTISLGGNVTAGADALLTAETSLETKANSNITAGHEAILKGRTISLGGNVTAGADARLTAETSLETGGASTVTAKGNVVVEGETISLAGKAVAGDDIAISGVKEISIRGQANLSGRHLALNSSMVALLGSSHLAYSDVAITLADFSADGLGGNWLIIEDGVTFSQRNSAAPPVVNVAGLGDDDTIDLRRSSLHSTWRLNRENGGYLERSGLQLNFAGMENILAGSGNDVLNILPGGAIPYMDLGGGYNTAVNRTEAPMTFEMDGNNRLIVSNRNRVIIPTLLNARAIVGSRQGDTLVYRDSYRPGFWVVDRDNQGALNNLDFSNITTSIHDAPGGVYDLYMRMDNLEIVGTPFTVTIHPGGSMSYFHEINLDRAVTVQDLRLRNNVVEKGLLNPGAAEPRDNQYLARAASEFLSRLDLMLKPAYDRESLIISDLLGPQAFTTKAESAEYPDESLPASGSTELAPPDEQASEVAPPLGPSAGGLREAGNSEEVAENLDGEARGEDGEIHAAAPSENGETGDT
jgi:hypothetical protein